MSQCKIQDLKISKVIPDKTFLYLIFLFFTIVSCTQNADKKFMKSWKVVKMQKLEKVTSNNYSSIDIEINNNMSYNFLSNGKVELITQSGSKLNGFWPKNDNVINVKVKNENKEFIILELTDENLIMISDKFKFYLESR